MKKILYCLFITILCVLCFSACGGSKTSESSTSEQKESNISFVHNEVSLSVGESVQLEVVTSKSNVFIFWSVRDTELATVSNDGVVTALAEGQTICYAEFAGEKVMCLIKITTEQAKPLLSVSVPYAESNAVIYVGDALEIKASVKFGDTVVDGAELEYTIDGNSVNVEDGKVVGLSVGSATVVISATYEGQTAQTTLTVKVVEL